MERFNMSNAHRMGKSDFVYYIHDGSAALGFRLSGDLSGDGVRELEQAWRTASSVIRGRRLVVDLSSITGVDDAGRELLGTWQAEGARMVAHSSAAKKRIESMIDRPVALLRKDSQPYAWPSFRVAPRWLAALLVLLFPAAVSTVNGGGADSTSANSVNCSGPSTNGNSSAGVCHPLSR